MAVRKKEAQKKSAGKKQPEKTGSQVTSGRVPVRVILSIFVIISIVAVFFAFLPVLRDKAFSYVSHKQPAAELETHSEQPLRPPMPMRISPTPPTAPPAVFPTPSPTAPPLPELPASAPPPVTGVPERPTPAPLPSALPEIRTPEQPVPLQPPSTLPVTRTPEQPAIETSNRAVYFMQLDRDGNIQHPVRVNRNLRASSSPLHDSLNALLSGPTYEERMRGLECFVPQRSRILSVQVRGHTAFINFNEDFQFNSLGREGCEAQLKQIVWTATEFPNVHNVQILIEGQRVDFISEGINIGHPIGR